MLEIYLFINPLGGICLNAEKSILDIVEQSQERIHFRFIPLLSPQSVDNMIRKNRLPSKDLKLRNELFNHQYLASLDSKAAALQGRKKGRSFLTSLQYEVAMNRRSFSPQLSVEVAERNHLDMDMFLMDREGELVRNLFEEDQRMAKEMNVNVHPSAVIFNFNREQEDCGLLVENCSSFEVLREICHFGSDKLIDIPQSLLKDPNITPISHRDLHVL